MGALAGLGVSSSNTSERYTTVNNAASGNTLKPRRKRVASCRGGLYRAGSVPAISGRDKFPYICEKFSRWSATVVAEQAARFNEDERRSPRTL